LPQCELIGAIGISGSAVENDHKVAEAGVNVLGVSELADQPFARMMRLRT
jgi:Haem-degrading